MKKKNMWGLIILIAILLLVWIFKIDRHYPRKINLADVKKDYWGVTFSKKMCDEIGLEWKTVYLGMLDDLKIKKVRLPIYWDEIEVEDDSWDFSDYDFMFDEGAKRGVEFIANIGWRLPRWPECHAPKWVESLENEKLRNILLIC